MHPGVMGLIIVGLCGFFAYSARNRWKLLQVGHPTDEPRTDRLRERLAAVWKFAFAQKKMRYYFTAGVAHQLIFLGFLVLLARSVVLWGRGFDPEFNLFILGPEGFAGLPLGDVYAFLKDTFAVLVLAGAAVFIYYRTIRPQRRMALSLEGLLILAIIVVMMLADILYDGAANVLNHRVEQLCQTASEWCQAASTIAAPLGEPAPPTWHFYPEPAASLVARLGAGFSDAALVYLAHAGFWTHATLVLVFLNILPYSKHFHIITAIPNVFLSNLLPFGRLRPVAENTEQLMEMVEKASEEEDIGEARIGYGRIQHFTWKDVLDFYTCTECGRCSDHCPATMTGKRLSPKHLTLDLRDHLYSRQPEVLALEHPIERWAGDAVSEGAANGADSSAGPGANGDQSARAAEQVSTLAAKDLIPDIIHPDVIWACTTCRACEEQCPVMITYVDKIVQMRRNEVMIRGDRFPSELNKPFEGMEVHGNPWNLTRLERANWAEGLNVPLASEKPDAEVLYWVGCAASYDDRAKKTARATARLLQQAGVDFAILGQEETCTGDPARRAGNEYLFTMLAEANVETLNGYKEQGGVRTIVTACPHCFNTLANEYPDFGGKYEVVHHTQFLLGLMAARRLNPSKPVSARVTYHDSCYLGRYNDVYEPPREILQRIEGVELVEPPMHHFKGLCCGAGGAQMWMEEQNKDRVNVKRTRQLLSTGAEVLASACPFCMTMLTDGLKNEEKEAQVQQLDVVELLERACL